MKLSAREKKLIAAAGIAGLLFVALEFLVLPATEEGAGGKEQLMLAQKELRNRRELVAAANEWQSQVATLQMRLGEEERRLLAAPDVNQAGAQLQEWLGQRAAEQQLQILRSDFLPPSALADTYVRVPVQLELSGRITQLVQFFTAILQAERSVALEELQIIGAGAGKEKRVRCVVVVTALMAKAG